MKLRKLLFVLPNLFTVSSIFCGFYALTLCCGEASSLQLFQAAVAILFGIFFDGCDGRVARLTKTQSAFGMELDSLADVITFGVAPGMLIYKWALHDFGVVGIFIAFAFTACGALRLARFNVLAQRSGSGGGDAYFVGLPIPIAAAMLVALVITHHAMLGGTLGTWAYLPVAVITCVLALMMVSTIRYRTFKKVGLSKKSASVFAGIAGFCVLVAMKFHPAFLLIALPAAYLAFGLVESGVLLRRHFVTRGKDGTAVLTAVDDDDDDDVEEDDDSDDEADLA
ncbi:MAG: CDP-diacylglycerol--serine O-phosphatidyltransferase [Myxococcaceae bacterium]